MNQLIGMRSVYTTTTNDIQKDYIEYYPVSVFAVIEALKNNKVTNENVDEFRKLFEDIPVCNNIAHINKKAETREHLINRFWKSNTRIKEFLFLKNLNQNHKIGFSYAQFITLKLLCNFDPNVQMCKHDTSRYTEVRTENNTDIMVVKLGQMKTIIDQINQSSGDEIDKFTLNNFLNSIPVCLNFIIDYEKQGGKIIDCSLYETTPYMREPQCQDIIMTFKMCVEMRGITDNCDVGMSMRQYETFKNLCRID